ncbi:MAG: hypothetical protein DCC63_14795 [Nitrospira sp.]|nr:MAG: hypothetical protein DCC63_14795 [Nitrospira sp.]
MRMATPQTARLVRLINAEAHMPGLSAEERRDLFQLKNMAISQLIASRAAAIRYGYQWKGRDRAMLVVTIAEATSVHMPFDGLSQEAQSIVVRRIGTPEFWMSQRRRAAG